MRNQKFAFTYTPWLQDVFGSYPLALHDGLLVAAVGVVFLLVIELEKRVLSALGVVQS